MLVSKPRTVLDHPVRWSRDPDNPTFSGALALNAGQTSFSGGSVLPPSVLTFSVDGTDPTVFQFKGNLHADDIGPVREWTLGWRTPSRSGRWPKQSLTVFQPLIPPDWKLTLRGGEMYAQVAFSAASDQGFEAGGTGC